MLIKSHFFVSIFWTIFYLKAINMYILDKSLIRSNGIYLSANFLSTNAGKNGVFLTLKWSRSN